MNNITNESQELLSFAKQININIKGNFMQEVYTKYGDAIAEMVNNNYKNIDILKIINKFFAQKGSKQRLTTPMLQAIIKQLRKNKKIKPKRSKPIQQSKTDTQQAIKTDKKKIELRTTQAKDIDDLAQF